MRRRTAAALLGLAALSPAAGAAAEPAEYAEYDRLLERHVDDGGLVDYATWKREDEAALREAVRGMAALDVEAMSPPGRKAHWINVYNAVTLQAILEAYPLDSIQELTRGEGHVWKDGRFGPRELSLDHVEHELLRPLGDPRIHAAIVCASVGCPPLRAEAYVAPRLDAQLDDNVRVWLADPERGVRVEGEAVYVSKVFSWFGADFAPDTAGRLRWIADHVEDAALARRLRGGELEVRSLEWDWSLNEQGG